MPAKKPAPRSAKGKKAASRPTARKAAVRKPAERAKAAAHVRKATATPSRRATPSRSTPNIPEIAETTEMRKVAEPATMEPAADLPRDDAPENLTAAAQTDPASERPEAQADAEAPAAEARVAEAAVAEARVAEARAASSKTLDDSEAQEDDTSGSDADDSDGADEEPPGSLLAGPRNVKPYVVKRGEQYMSKEQLEHFRQILLNWKKDLMEEVDRTVSHMKDEAANFPDPNDRATQEEEFSLELRTRDRERKLIRKIDEALKRIDDGTYGYCLETGEEIGIKRLEARPVATLCLEAQERRERRERQYGDRDDRYR